MIRIFAPTLFYPMYYPQVCRPRVQCGLGSYNG